MSEIIKPITEFTPIYDGYYRHQRTCDNCRQMFQKAIIKGKRIPTIIECPNCGCETDGNIFKDHP